MKLELAVEILKEFNKWRRGEDAYGWYEEPEKNSQLPYTPAQIGVAIDTITTHVKQEFEMKQYAVTYRFIENGHECKATWGGGAVSKEAAIKISSDWYGFKKDGIRVLSCEVKEL
jgi:hypothetical protein